MTLIHHRDQKDDGSYPGVKRLVIVDGEHGAKSLMMVVLSVEPGAVIPTHTHPVEEAMTIVDGEAEVVDGNERRHVKSEQTLHCLAGVRHGFRNTGDKPLKLVCAFPTAKVTRDLVDGPQP